MGQKNFAEINARGGRERLRICKFAYYRGLPRGLDGTPPFAICAGVRLTDLSYLLQSVTQVLVRYLHASGAQSAQHHYAATAQGKAAQNRQAQRGHERRVGDRTRHAPDISPAHTGHVPINAPH